MKKSLMTLAVTVTLAAGTAQAATFNDVSGNWAQTDINTMTNMQVMAGFNDGQFHPDAWVTRAEFGNMALKTLGLQPNQISQVPSFRGVTQNQWNFGTVDNQAWISAYPQGVFRPENPVRRAEVMAALAGAINRPLVSEAEAEQILSRFTDANQVPPNMRREVATAVQYNLFAIDPQFSNQLQPMQPADRADVAAMLGNLHENRSIAIVPVTTRGSTVATTTTTTTTTSPGMTTTSTANVRGTMNNPVTVQNQNQAFGNDPDIAEPHEGYNTMSENTWYQSSVPYRHSADTIQATRFGDAPSNIQPINTANLPANTTFTGTVAKALYSEFNRPGDPVMLILDHTLFGANGAVVAPAGSRVLGQVTRVVPNNTSGDHAEIGIQFSEIVTPTGARMMINGTVANADGILRSNALQGVVIHPQRSIAALGREINTAQGALYGTKDGKMNVLETPLVTLGSDQVIRDLDQRTTPNVVIGVGDRLQVRIGAPVSTNQPVSQ